MILAGAMALLILVAAARLLAYAVPEDLRVLSLLGAEPAFVRRPFELIGGAVTGLGAAFGGLAALAAVRLLDPMIQRAVQGYGLEWRPIWPEPAWFAGGLALAILVGGLAGSVGSTKHSS
jgi:cell division protein FtsX